MSELKKRNFHEAQWDESIIYEQSVPGSRGVLVPDVSEEASKVTGDVSALMPASLKRKQKPDLPELAQPQVLRHFLRLSQETIQDQRAVRPLPQVHRDAPLSGR